MFYAHFVLAKKGPLAKVWLAAHWDRKLTKANVFETDVETTVETIISPKVKIALRTSGHLLLGVVRIYSRKAKYLLHDCSEAFAKIRMAFRPGVVDLPLETRAADSDVITFPELFKDFESAVADLNDLNIESQFALNQAPIGDITIPESDYFTMENVEKLREAPPSEISSNIDVHLATDKTVSAEVGDGINWGYEQQNNDDFGGDFDVGAGAKLNLEEEGVEISVGFMEEAARPQEDFEQQPEQQPEEEEEAPTELPMEITNAMPPSPVDQENFELEPMQVSGIKDRGRRKRKLVVDSSKQITGASIRSQLEDFSDTMQTRCFPPPTKKSLLWKKVAGCEYLFANPTSYPFSDEMASLVINNFTAKGQEATPDSAIESLRPAVEDSREIADQLDKEKQQTPPADTSDQGWQGDFVADQPPINDPTEQAAPDVIDFGDQISMAEIPDVDIPSVDNRQTEEFSEEYEEQRWGKRTRQILSRLQRGFSSSDDINFKALTKNCTRKMAASRFYTCLLLAKEGAIVFDQSGAYEDIYITKGSKYDIAV